MEVGRAVGFEDRMAVGCCVGECDGDLVGADVGFELGAVYGVAGASKNKLR